MSNSYPPWYKSRAFYAYVICFLLMLSCVVYYQYSRWVEPASASVVLEDQYAGKPGRLVRVVPKHLSSGVHITWHYHGDMDVIPQADGSAWVLVPQSGKFKLWAITAPAKNNIEMVETWLVIGDPGPGPGPGPGPTPDPKPTPAPITADGLHLLVVFDDSAKDKLTPGQWDAIYGQAFRDNLNAKCVGDGNTKAWRIWSSKANPSGESKKWQDAFARPRQSLPWLIISNPQKGGGFEGPLPANLTDTQALVQKYGG